MDVLWDKIAQFVMPELISTSDFVQESWEDFNSPTTSSFVPRMGKCKNTVAALEEVRQAFGPMQKGLNGKIYRI